MNIAAVITTYNKVDIFEKVLKSLNDQSCSFSQIVVVDNGKNEEIKEIISSCNPGIIYRQFKENIGSAGGFYEGIKLAYQINDYVFTLDDDVVVHKKTVEELIPYIKKLETNGKLGAIRPNMVNTKDKIIEIESFAWRGTLIKSQVIKEIGLPRKRYFLYGEDIEFAMRIRKARYKIYNIAVGKLREINATKSKKVNVFGIEFKFYQEAFRLYYAFRNQTAIYLENRCYGQIVRTTLYAVKGLIFNICFLNYKNIAAILEGCRDGMNQRLGKNEKYTPYLV